MEIRILAVSTALVVLCALPSAAADIFEATTGIAVAVTPEGQYTITANQPRWRFGGDFGRPLTNLTINTGSDTVGFYQEIVFNYSETGARQAGIRTYAGKPILLFSIKYLEEAANVAPFPKLSTFPQLPFHLSYRGVFAGHHFGKLTPEGPWLFYDSGAAAFLVSPASHFNVANMVSGDGGEIASGIDPAIGTLPADLTYRTILVIENGINKAFDTWGQALTDLQGKTRPANDADVSLTSLGYWTDFGSTYYYRFDPALGYAGTLLAVRDDFRRQGIPLGYLQLDSWFYPKGPDAQWGNTGGIHHYEAEPLLFPQGLKAFQKQLGVPLIAHARWIDAQSPYRRQYQISGNVATDSVYWENIANYINDSGVVTYEQDWLGGEAQAALNLTDRKAYLGSMARACLRKAITIQYCMALPRHFLQSSNYTNVTTIRTSPDRFERDKWQAFLFSSRLASALGLWPWSDVFMSGEADNLLLSTLSAGPVGIGDPVGSLNADNLFRTIRKDGVIVKPDVPMAPVDETYIADAQGADRPLVASTYSDFGDLKALYVFAFDRGRNLTATFTPSSLGLDRPVFVYNYFGDFGKALESGESYSEDIANGRSYYIVAPIGPSGIAFLGDAGHFVSLGKKRIPQVSDNGTLQATITFAKGEGVRTLHGYSPSAPVVSALRGAAGRVAYDSETQLFRFTVSPDSKGSAMIEISVPPSLLQD